MGGDRTEEKLWMGRRRYSVQFMTQNHLPAFSCHWVPHHFATQNSHSQRCAHLSALTSLSLKSCLPILTLCLPGQLAPAPPDDELASLASLGLSVPYHCHSGPLHRLLVPSGTQLVLGIACSEHWVKDWGRSTQLDSRNLVSACSGHGCAGFVLNAALHMLRDGSGLKAKPTTLGTSVIRQLKKGRFISSLETVPFLPDLG